MARERLDKDPAGVAQPIDYVRRLAEASHAGVRALIFELRPERAIGVGGSLQILSARGVVVLLLIIGWGRKQVSLTAGYAANARPGVQLALEVGQIIE
jgi:hypothetical protein